VQTLINNIFGYISNNDLFGVIPLDIICHIIIGLVVTKVCLKLNLGFIKTLIVVSIMAIGKEYYDSFVLYNGNKALEHFKDIFFTLVPIFFMYLSFRAKESVKNQNSVA
jgi:hypothetical protein